MKRLTLLMLFAVLAIPSHVQSEPIENEDTFLTLTRRATPRRNLPSNVSVVTSQDIQESGALSLPDLLDRLPGVDLSRSGSLGSLTSIRMRGATTADQVQILLDDQPLGGVSVQNINLDLIPLADIERIEVVRGGSSVLYGANTIGGVVHIFTKKHTSEKTQASVKTEVGSLHTRIQSAKAGAKNDRIGGTLINREYTTEGFQKNADVKNRDTAGDLNLFFPNGASVGLNASYTDRELGSPNGTTVALDQWDGDREREPNSTTQRVENRAGRNRIKGSIPFSNVGSLETSVYQSREIYKLRLTASSDPLATYDNRIYGQDTRLVFDQGTIFGIAAERNERRSQGQIPRHITNWGSYLQHEWVKNKLVLIPAVRFDQHSTYGNQWNPRLTAVFKARDNFHVSANAARAYRSPTLVDLYIVATDPFFPAFDFFGNPNLSPERATTYDLGVWSKLGGILESSITGFFTRISDRIDTVDTDGNGNVDTLQNLSKAESYGVELEAQLNTWKLTHKTNLTLQRAKGTSGEGSAFRTLRLTPRYLFNYEIVCPLPGQLRLSNTLQSVGAQYERDNQAGFRLPSYSVWNSRLSTNRGPLNIFFSVQNILDKRYAESVTFGNGVPQPGRTYWGGVELSL